MPLVTPDVVRDYAAREGVCVRPVVRTVTDRETGDTATVLIRCGSTRESRCPPCATRARRLRMQQCAEGWHLDEDPLPPEPEPDSETDDPDHDVDETDDQAEEDEGEGEVAPGSGRRVRSTRRRSDAADLPRTPQDHRSIGQTFTAPDGTTYRPSMFVTLTLGSYGKVRDGTPLHPDSYGYWRAGVEAMFFTRLFDRWVQNLRRCAGFKVQYFGAVEAQHRLAPHIHLALRGAIPRRVLRQVTRATYLQLWWPSFRDEDVAYPDPVEEPDRQPWWDHLDGSYRDPDTGFPLPTWEEALDDLANDLDARPPVVMRFGSQVDIKGIIAPSEDANRSIRYLTKYLTKAVTETFTDPDHPEQTTGTYEAHIEQLHAVTARIPCSESCANWLRYGIQPRNPGPGLVQGMCGNKAHDRDHLGIGGRRVQVSRAWSGKTLSEHKADRATVVREVLAEAGIEPLDADRMAADVLASDGKPRFVWDDIPLTDRDDYVQVVLLAVQEAQRWRREYEHAKAGAANRAGGSRASPTSTQGPQPLWKTIRQPDPLVLPTTSQTRSPDRLSRVSEANHEVTPKVPLTDGQAT